MLSTGFVHHYTIGAAVPYAISRYFEWRLKVYAHLQQDCRAYFWRVPHQSECNGNLAVSLSVSGWQPPGATPLPLPGWRRGAVSSHQEIRHRRIDVLLRYACCRCHLLSNMTGASVDQRPMHMSNLDLYHTDDRTKYLICYKRHSQMYFRLMLCVWINDVQLTICQQLIHCRLG